jgi:hypothetical protein
VDYEQNWGAGAFGSDGYNEGFGGSPGEVPGVYGGYQPSGGQQHEDFSPGTQEVRIRAPQPSVTPEAVAQTRALLGLGAPPAQARQRQVAQQQAPVSKSTYVIPLVLAGAIGLGYWYWTSGD